MKIPVSCIRWLTVQETDLTQTINLEKCKMTFNLSWTNKLNSPPATYLLCLYNLYLVFMFTSLYLLELFYDKKYSVNEF